MSDSEDDFMSDKFLVEVTKPSETYSTSRSKQALKSHRLGQAKNLVSHKQLEAERRHVGLSTSLFDTLDPPSEGSTSANGGGIGIGGNKAMEMMKKMGWKVGEGIGRKRSASPDLVGEKRVKIDEDIPRGGIGSKPRLEPIRVSMWAGRKGLSARSPSPPPLPSRKDPDALDPKKLARLGQETESFRERQRREFSEKEVERKESKARDILVKLDNEKGIKFHPLHVLPLDPLSTLPKPLLHIIYPTYPVSPSRSPSPIQAFTKDKNLSAAEKMREQIRKDMLSDIPDQSDDDEGEVKFGIGTEKENGIVKEQEELLGELDWQSFVSGTKKVLSMEPSTHLTFLVDQLRHEHLYCLWCSFKYGSLDEMEGSGGCPGPEEDDH